MLNTQSRIAISVAAVLALAATARAQNAESASQLDEVVVTGSHIKRSEYQLSSPVDVLLRDEIEIRAPQTMANYLADLPYNFGSSFSSGRALGNERGAGTVNLRGLGASATLVLLNSRRQTQIPDNPDNVVDVNSLVPEIMLERTEILKDGASAVYGTDAVSGVVNFLTRDRFDGFQIGGRMSEATYAHEGDRRLEILWGTGLGSNTRLVAAFGAYEQDLMTGMPQTAPSQAGMENDIRMSSASSWPGEFTVPVRGANGQVLAGTAGRRANVVDPTCGQIVSSIPALAPVPGQLPVAASGPAAAADCRYQFWSDNALQSEINRYQAFLRLTSHLTDKLNLSAEAGYANVQTATPYTAGDTVSIPVTIPGHNPGNLYRAVNASAQPLFAVSSGVSAGFDRDGAPVFLPSRNTAGQVILAPVPNVQSAGTIPFYEDVSYAGRLIGSQGGLPTNNSVGPGQFAESRMSESENSIARGSVVLDGNLVGDWDWEAGATYSSYRLATNGTVGVGLGAQLNRALNGFGGTNCDPTTGTRGQGGCQYFNVFGNSTFATSVGDPRANTTAVLDYVLPLLHDLYKSSLIVGDATVTGKPWDLPAGPFGIAIGYQYRENALEIDFDANKNIGNTTTGTIQEDFDQSRATNAAFVEVNVPILKSGSTYFEANGAVRYEDSGGDLTTTDPKLGLLFTAYDGKLALRGSYGTSFVSPSLFRLYAVSSANPAVNDCAPTRDPVCTGVVNLRIAAQTRGNINLEPQTSTAESFGVTLKPFQDLTLTLDWWHFTFEKLITTETATQLVNFDPTGAITGRVKRDPATNALLSVVLQYYNAPEMTTSGYDFGADYNVKFDKYGNLRLNLSGTYIDEYQLTQLAGQAPINAAGRSNDGVAGASPNTRFRANFRTTWSGGNHSLTALLHYYAPLTFTLDPTYEIDSWMPLDITYNYSLPTSIFGKDTGLDSLQFSLGATNVLDEQEPYVPFPGFQPFIPSLYDLRGQIFWGSIVAKF